MSLKMIRKATLSDYAALTKISTATFYDTYVELNPENSALLQAYVEEMFNEQIILNELKREEVSFYLFEIENQVIGYAKTIIPLGSPRLEIEKFYLVKGQGGKGLGKQLFLHIKTLALSHGQKSIWLSVYDQNITAINFYLRLGFEKISEKDFIFNWNGQVYKDRDWILEVIL